MPPLLKTSDKSAADHKRANVLARGQSIPYFEFLHISIIPLLPPDLNSSPHKTSCLIISFKKLSWVIKVAQRHQAWPPECNPGPTQGRGKLTPHSCLACVWKRARQLTHTWVNTCDTVLKEKYSWRYEKIKAQADIFCLSFIFWGRVSLFSPGGPGTHW